MKSIIKNLFLTGFVFYIACFIAIVKAQTSDEYSVSFSDANSGTLVGTDGLIMRTDDGGATWSAQTSGTNEALYGNDQLDANVGISVGANGTILMTADGGATWTVRQSTTEMKLRSVRFINSSEIIACGDAGVIVRSEDAGDNWEVVNSNTGANLRDIHFIDDNIGFAAGESSTFLTSIDGGRTWSTPSAGSDNYSSVYMRTLMIGTVVGEDDLLLMTIDGGNTWTPFELTAAVNNSYNSVTYADASVGVAVGNGGLIARTEDGAAWTLITSPTTENLYSVEFSDGTHGVCVGSNDIRLYSDDAGVTWTIGNNNAIHPKVYNPGLMPNDFSLSQNYPNPFNPSTKINYQLPSDSKVTLQVFDMSGREVRSLVNSFQTAGTYSITFDANGLASGIYFYRLAAGNFVKTMKMSLVK